MQKEVERLREEREALVTAAYQQDEAEEAAVGSRRGDELPAVSARALVAMRPLGAGPLGGVQVLRIGTHAPVPAVDHRLRDRWGGSAGRRRRGPGGAGGRGHRG